MTKVQPTDEKYRR